MFPDIRAQRLDANGNRIGGPFFIAGGTDAQRRYPDVTYNPIADQYLVVWEGVDDSTGYNTISARRVSWDGVVQETSDIIITGPSNLYTPTKPAVAYSSSSDRYLVVWAETWHPTPLTHTIYGQVMQSNGALDAAAFAISSGPEIRAEPDVAYNRHANRYQVVWEQDNVVWDIMGRQVHGSGGYSALLM